MVGHRSSRFRLGVSVALFALALTVIGSAVGAGVVLDRRAPGLTAAFYEPAVRAVHGLAHQPATPAAKGGPTVAQMAADQFEVQDPGATLTGTVLLALQGSTKASAYPHRIVEVDRTGAVVWEYHPPESGRIGDVRKLANGDVLYEIHPGAGAIEARGGVGTVVEVNHAGSVVRHMAAVVDHHAELLDSGNLLVASAAEDSVSEYAPDGALVWTWKAADHVKPYNASTFPGWNAFGNLQNIFTTALDGRLDQELKDTEVGWLHTNSVQRLTNGDTLISERNADTVIEVDEAGEILASYGALIFKHQHCAFVIPAGSPGAGHMLVTDNGNGRVVEMDMATQRIVWKYDTGLSIPEEGCAYRLPDGDTLITDSYHLRVLEVNMAGQVQWQLVVKTPSTESLYRAWWSPPAS